MKRVTAALMIPLVLLSLNGPVFAHCEIPCGIYGDDARFAAMFEDITTIEKSMKLINELSGAAEKNFNQIVRWVNNKETHADHIREIVAQYFLAQRIKVPAEGDAAAQKAYTGKLALLHQIVVATMKCKQTTDLENVKKLHDLVQEFQNAYRSK